MMEADCFQRCSDRTRGNRDNLEHRRFPLDIRKQFFSAGAGRLEQLDPEVPSHLNHSTDMRLREMKDLF